MKTIKLLLSCSLISAAFSLRAQIYEEPVMGNVGIGTMSPAAKLHIGQNNSEIRFDYDGTNGHYGSLRWAGLQLGNNGQNRIIAGRSATGGFLDFYVNNTNDGADYSIGPNGTLAMRINPEGKVGIGTTSPFSQLHVKDGAYTGTISLGSDVYPALISSSAVSGEFRIDNRSSFIGYISFYPNGQSAAVGAEAMRIVASGNVGIGTSSPTEKLAVNGKIRAQEIKVEASPWPDYVFAKDYRLPSLQQTENHIKENGHLPGIPSAAEVKTNGIDLGEMNAKLLQKIEELTLHLIEIKKENQEIKNQVKILMSK